MTLSDLLEIMGQGGDGVATPESAVRHLSVVRHVSGSKHVTGAQRQVGVKFKDFFKDF